MPSVMTLILPLLAMALTADLLVTEKEAGLLIRDHACGVALPLFILSQPLCMLAVVLPQIILCIIVLVVAFPSLPTLCVFTMAALLLLQSFCGMSLGMLLAASLRSRERVIQAGLGVVMPLFLLSGVLWPRAGFPPWLSKLALILPTTVSCEVARAIAINETVQVPLIAWSFAIPAMWTSLFFALCVWITKSWGYKA